MVSEWSFVICHFVNLRDIITQSCVSLTLSTKRQIMTAHSLCEIPTYNAFAFAANRCLCDRCEPMEKQWSQHAVTKK